MYDQTWSTIQGLGLTLALSVLVLVAPSHAQDDEPSLKRLEERVKQLEERVKTDDESPYDPYVSEFGGRIMADFTVNTDQSRSLRNNLGVAEDGFEFRRLRLYAEGPIGEVIEYKIQLDFAGNAVSVKDAYVGVSDLPYLPDFKVGHLKEPFSLDELTSSKYITFMSRSALSDGFTAEYNPGIFISEHWADDRINLSAALTQANVNGLETPRADGNQNLTARLTSPVVYRSDRNLVHLGAAYSIQQPTADGDSYVRDLEPEVHKGDPEFLEAEVGNVENWDQYGLEFATVQGPVSVQAEWAQHSLNRSSGTEPDLDSYYAFVSYFLTGEHRPYDRGAGDFGRVEPNQPFVGAGKVGGGPGAWEIAARYSSTDYSEASGVTARAANLATEMDVITLGLNWYPHAHAKWMLNYVDAEQDALNGDAQWLATRFQVDF